MHSFVGANVHIYTRIYICIRMLRAKTCERYAFAKALATGKIEGSLFRRASTKSWCPLFHRASIHASTKSLLAILMCWKIHMCLYICKHVYIYICMSIYIYMYVCIYIHMYIFIYIYMYTYIYIHVYVHVHISISIHIWNMYVYIRIFTYIYMCVYIYIYIYVYSCQKDGPQDAC